MEECEEGEILANLLIVTSKYRPEVCGVGDYSALLAERLRGLGQDVDVFTAGSGPSEPGVFRCASWTASAVRELADWIGQQGYTHVLLQYTPTGYSRKGAFPPVALLPRLLQRTYPSCRVVTTLHELFYVFNLAEWRRVPRNLTVGTSQRLFLAEVVRHSDALVVTTGERRQFLATAGRRLGWNTPLHEIPVGTNIEPVPMTTAERQCLKGTLGLDGIVLGSFSRASESGLLLAALEAVRAGGMEACLLAVGAEPSYFGADSRYAALAPFIRCTGKVPETEASRLLRLMDVYLLPLSDGISARRTTLVAALAHALPTVATWGRSTDPWMRESSAFCFAPAGNMASWTRAVREAASDPAQRDRLREAAAALFAARFTWDAIAQGYEKVIEETLRLGKR